MSRKNTSISINREHISINIEGKEYFKAFADFPELKDFTISELSNYRLDRENNICWEEKDFDIELESLIDKEKFNLKYKN